MLTLMVCATLLGLEGLELIPVAESRRSATPAQTTPHPSLATASLEMGRWPRHSPNLPSTTSSATL